MATRKKAFDAVTKSRNWKETVARQTAGMASREVLEFFNREKVLARLEALRKKSSRTIPAH